MVPLVPSYHQLQWKHASFKKFLFVYLYFSHNMCFTDFLGNAFDREDCVEHRWFFWCMFHTWLKRQFPRKAGKGKAFKLFISQILMRWATSKHVGWAVDTGTRKLCRTLLVIHVFCPWQLSRLSYQSSETGPESQEILKFASWSDCCQHGAWYFLQEAENLGTENSVQDCSGDFDDLPHSTIFYPSCTRIEVPKTVDVYWLYLDLCEVVSDLTRPHLKLAWGNLTIVPFIHVA